jgi:dienelactone hydrolase
LSEFEYTEVSFENIHEDLQLAGMLFVPYGEGPFPTVIVIHGAGESERNSPWYLSVVKHLRQNGIAVLLPDKRGCVKSGGEWVGASFEELATDTLSAIDYVKQQEIFEYSSIGLVGFSQGGWIVPIVATKSVDVDFIVSMSGASVTVDEQLVHGEFTYFEPYTYTFLAKWIAPISASRVRQMPHISVFADFDPLPYLTGLRIPVFFAYGENDTAVPVEASLERLREENLDRFLVKVYPGGGHAIKNP